MRLIRLSVLALALVCIFSATGSAYSGVCPEGPLFDFQQRVFRTINSYWEVQEHYISYIRNETKENEEIWKASVERFEELSLEIALEVFESTNKTILNELEVMSAIYKSLPDGAKNSLYTSISHLKFQVLHSNNNILTDEHFRQYFPGYGYTEPGYRYRKGRELDREFKGYNWQQEEHSISTTLTVNLTVTLDVVDILRRLLTGGFIRDLHVSEPFHSTINGQPMFVANVSFQRITAIKTKTTRKFEINKIWFELLRARSTIWGTGDWNKVGRTYEIMHEPTGQDYVTDISAE